MPGRTNCVFFGLLCWGAALEAVAEPVSFSRQVAPVLKANCVKCHGPRRSEGGYRLDSYKRLMAAIRPDAKAFVGENLEASQAYQRIIDPDDGRRMPQAAPRLAADQVALIKRWIEAGARFDGKDPQASLDDVIPPPEYPAAPEAYDRAPPVLAVAFGPEAREVFAGGQWEVTVWDAADGRLRRRLGNFPQRILDLEFSPDGEVLAVAGGSPGQPGEVRIVDPQSGKLQKFLPATLGVVWEVAFSPDGSHLAVGTGAGLVDLYQVDGWKKLRTLPAHGDMVTTLAWNGDGSLLASGARDGSVRLHDAKDGRRLVSYSGHKKEVLGLSWHPDGKHICSAGRGEPVHVWAAADGKLAEQIAADEPAPFAFVAVGHSLYLLGVDKQIRQIDLDDRTASRLVGQRSQLPLSGDADPTEKLFVDGCLDGRVTIWTLRDGKSVASFIAAPGQ